jgi:hypothetical protein
VAVGVAVAMAVAAVGGGDCGRGSDSVSGGGWDTRASLTKKCTWLNMHTPLFLLLHFFSTCAACAVGRVSRTAARSDMECSVRRHSTMSYRKR